MKIGKYFRFLITAFFLLSPANVIKNISKKNQYTPELHQQVEQRFIVQNLATLTVRVYHRPCAFESICENFLIYEAPMVIGKMEEGYMTKLGAYQISSWAKFYQDIDKEFDPWYKKPAPIGADRHSWGNNGVFGWYTALLEPNADGQWLHGTVGWGADGERFIQHNKTPNGNYDRLRSRGCTRVSNQSIAFLRNFVPEGSWVFRIYAQEELKDKSLKKYSHLSLVNSWNYTFGRGKDKTKFPLEEDGEKFYEKGTLMYVQIPSVKVAVPQGQKKLKQINNNPYELQAHEFRGRFLVDTGEIDEYLHPKRLPMAGGKVPLWFKRGYRGVPQLATNQ